MASKKILTDLPVEADADQTVEDFKSEGCTQVKKEKQANGKWMVTAICPDK